MYIYLTSRRIASHIHTRFRFSSSFFSNPYFLSFSNGEILISTFPRPPYLTTTSMIVEFEKEDATATATTLPRYEYSQRWFAFGANAAVASITATATRRHVQISRERSGGGGAASSYAFRSLVCGYSIFKFGQQLIFIIGQFSTVAFFNKYEWLCVRADHRGTRKCSTRWSLFQ